MLFLNVLFDLTTNNGLFLDKSLQRLSTRSQHTALLTLLSKSVACNLSMSPQSHPTGVLEAGRARCKLQENRPREPTGQGDWGLEELLALT